MLCLLHTEYTSLCDALVVLWSLRCGELDMDDSLDYSTVS